VGADLLGCECLVRVSDHDVDDHSAIDKNCCRQKTDGTCANNDGSTSCLNTGSIDAVNDNR
jgi:hypothetical protein